MKNSWMGGVKISEVKKKAGRISGQKTKEGGRRDG